MAAEPKIVAGPFMSPDGVAQTPRGRFTYLNDEWPAVEARG
jgi:hypothetical protein